MSASRIWAIRLIDVCAVEPRGTNLTPGLMPRGDVIFGPTHMMAIDAVSACWGIGQFTHGILG